jgi:hypothetical protein
LQKRHLIVLLAGLLCTTALGEDWPQFRGPTGLGHTTEKNLPTTWDAKTGDNVLWKSSLKGEGHASPVVVGDRVFTCTVEWPADVKDRKKVIPDHFVTCYSVTDGRQLWQTPIQPGPWVRDDFRSGPGGGYAAPTPCTDGKQLYVVFSSSVMAALDLTGKVVWRKEIIPYTFDVTIGTSPVLHGKNVLFVCMMAKKGDSRIAAFSKETGDLAWEAKAPAMGFGHSTPVIVEVNGKPQMLVVAGAMGSGGDAMQSFDPADGKRLWWCKGGGESSSPAFGKLSGGGSIVFFDSGRGGNGTAVDPTGEGDVSKSHIKWTTGNYGEAISSPIIVGDHVYRLISGSVLKCWNAKTGDAVYSERLPVTSTWASPVADGDGNLYFASAGKTAVVKSGPEYKLLATNDLGDGNHASMGVSNGKLFFVGLKQVWCVGKK